MRTPSPADAADRAMRGPALISLSAHALVLVAVTAWGLAPANVPAEAEARIEVTFGNNAAASGPPAAATKLPAVAPATVVRDPSAESAAPAATAPTAHPSGGQLGLLVPHRDRNMVEAQADPGNRAPKYPDGAWLAHEQGEVVLRLHVGPDGRVSRVELRRSSGHASLDQAAIAALARWRFVPALRDGVAVPSYRDQATDFELEGGR